MSVDICLKGLKNNENEMLKAAINYVVHLYTPLWNLVEVDDDISVNSRSKVIKENYSATCSIMACSENIIATE